ncbi:MAG TPA: L-seryl-tRNA(Sec) selenium transferase [Clostridia bacterium]|nr:L-seryl-tRNA(Sec) selenium transferase [Clostridia bacterium]
MKHAELLRKIPKVDAVIGWMTEADAIHTPPLPLETEAIQETLGFLRDEILSGVRQSLPAKEELIALVRYRLQRKTRPNLRRVINATGIVLHTNLGRALLGERAVHALVDVAQSYSNLEYDIEQRTRGSRHALVEELITKLTGAESAMVVNNNAAAMLLILNTIAKERKVVISRGELVEIGASFRIPAIIEQSGALLSEVGTTNKTHLSDFERAIDPSQTAALLKVHTSNFRIVGFSETPSIRELADLGKRTGLPVIYDAGSGMMTDLQKYGIQDEPLVPQCVADGADIVCFSGDKLLGGPQAGVIVGRKPLIDAMKKNQLARALRIDKLTLAALEATLRAYLDGTAEEEIPTLRMISEHWDILADRANELAKSIRAYAPDCAVEVVEECGQVGGGAVPGQMLPSYIVALQPKRISVDELEKRLRLGEPPIIARISKDRLLLDVRTLREPDARIISERLKVCLCETFNGNPLTGGAE